MYKRYRTEFFVNVYEMRDRILAIGNEGGRVVSVVTEVTNGTTERFIVVAEYDPE